jgi:vesicular inhibitory amino acid transporter
MNHLCFPVSNRLSRAKFLASIVVSEPSIRSYADIGRHAFGARSMPFVTFLFCFETFSVG